MSGKIDFSEVKRDHPIDRVAERLGLVLKPHGQQLRGTCFSGEGGDRALVITPSKGVWYSHALKKGGDVIELVASAKNLAVRDAALWITGAVPEKTQTGSGPTAGLKPVELTHDHPMVLVSGLEADDATRFGIGYREEVPGKTRAGAGNVLIPVYANGILAGYVGVQEITWLPEKWRA